MKGILIILLFICGTLGAQISYTPGVKDNFNELRLDPVIKEVPIILNHQTIISSLAADRVAVPNTLNNPTSTVAKTGLTTFPAGSTVSLTIDEKPHMTYVPDYFDSVRIHIVVGVDALIVDSFDFHIFRMTEQDMEFGTTNSDSATSIFRIPLLDLPYSMQRIDTTIALSLGKGDYITWGTWNTAATPTMKWNVSIYGIRPHAYLSGKPLAATPQFYLNLEDPTEPFAAIPQRAANGTLDNGCFTTTNWTSNASFITNVCVSQSVESDYNYTIERSDSFARAGTNSLKFLLRATQPDSFPAGPGEASHRAELRLDDFPVAGEEVWYGTSYYFPADYIPSGVANEVNTRYIVTQWQHGTPGSPSVALEILSNNIAMVRKYGTSNGGETSLPTVKFATITPGTWMDIVVKVKWSKTAGEVQVWVNGVNKYSDYLPTMYNDLAVGGSFKVGVYHFNWKEAAYIAFDAADGIFTRRFFVDEVKQYTGINGYSIVKAL